MSQYLRIMSLKMRWPWIWATFGIQTNISISIGGITNGNGTSGGITNGNGTSGSTTNGGTTSRNHTSGKGTNFGTQIKNGVTKYVTLLLFLLSILSSKVYWHLFTLCKESGAANRTHLVQQWRKSENQLNLMCIIGSCLILVDIQAQNVVFLCKSKQGCTPYQTLWKRIIYM